MNPREFLDFLRYAIGSVGPGYYGYSERVYCYELYHFLRVAMFHRQLNSTHPHLYLHSEIVKVVLNHADAENIGVYPLGNQRSPDFILHEPNTAANQIAVVEVKVTPNVGYAACLDDLEKLSELKRSYHFQVGVFLCINSGINRVFKHIKRARDEGRELDPEVIIMAVPKCGQQIQEQTIGQLLS
ncbi:hypothetical protein [Pokkaliibacter plantistimulans]|uniref:hypothetical protein n=1 Tax=Pokkaliibacter plantistimulans TaxID=1635171 RepID=UPI001057A6E8|nr:hypothetical protein [Pokkaliibacter plantistimulans]